MNGSTGLEMVSRAWQTCSCVLCTCLIERRVCNLLLGKCFIFSLLVTRWLRVVNHALKCKCWVCVLTGVFLNCKYFYCLWTPWCEVGLLSQTASRTIVLSSDAAPQTYTVVCVYIFGIGSFVLLRKQYHILFCNWKAVGELWKVALYQYHLQAHFMELRSSLTYLYLMFRPIVEFLHFFICAFSIQIPVLTFLVNFSREKKQFMYSYLKIWFFFCTVVKIFI